MGGDRASTSASSAGAPGRGWEQFEAPQGLERSLANVITADSSGRTWLGYQRGELVLVVGDSVRVFAAEQGLDVGRVLAISVYGNRVWIGGQSGVAAFDAREARRAGSRLFVPLLTAGEPLRGVSGVVETADGELWLNGADGVTRIPAAEVRRALTEPGYQVRYERLDYRDGIEPPAQQIRPLPSAAAGTDGRIWFATAGGVAWVDPRRVRRNAVPPPVHLRALTAGGRRYFAGQSAGDTVRLPPRTSALSVAYTAYSLAVPDRVRFKYRLEGLDTTWQDAGGRREAFFTNLPPGRYRFHVIASNDDGVWNTTGASLAFAIEPAWNQTWWFFGLVALTLVAAPVTRRGRVAAPPRTPGRGAYPKEVRGGSRGAHPRRPRAARQAARRHGGRGAATGCRRPTTGAGRQRHRGRRQPLLDPGLPGPTGADRDQRVRGRHAHLRACSAASRRAGRLGAADVFRDGDHGLLHANGNGSRASADGRGGDRQHRR